MALLSGIFGTAESKSLKSWDALVLQVNKLEPEYSKLNDEGLKAKTDEFRSKLASGQTLDDILPEAFAAIREASKRTLGERHFDVQLLGGIALHNGGIAEMRTGEPKL